MFQQLINNLIFWGIIAAGIYIALAILGATRRLRFFRPLARGYASLVLRIITTVAGFLYEAGPEDRRDGIAYVVDVPDSEDNDVFPT